MNPTPPENPQTIAESVRSMPLNEAGIDGQMKTLRDRCERLTQSEQLGIIITALRRREEHAETTEVLRKKLRELREELEGRLANGSIVPLNPVREVYNVVTDPRRLTGEGEPGNYWTWKNIAVSGGVGIVGTLLTVTGIKALWNLITDEDDARGKLKRFFTGALATALGFFGLGALINARRLGAERPEGGRVALLSPTTTAPVTVGEGQNALTFQRIPGANNSSSIVLNHTSGQYRLVLPLPPRPTQVNGATVMRPFDADFSTMVTGISRPETGTPTPAFDIGSAPMLQGWGLQLGSRVLHVEIGEDARRAIAGALTAPAQPNTPRSAVVPLRINVRGLTDTQIRMISEMSTGGNPTQSGDFLTIFANMRLDRIGDATPAPTEAPAFTTFNNRQLVRTQAHTLTGTAARTDAISLGGGGTIAANTDGNVSHNGVTLTRSGNTLTVVTAANAAAGDRVITIGSTTVTLKLTEAPVTIPALTTFNDRALVRTQSHTLTGTAAANQAIGIQGGGSIAANTDGNVSHNGLTVTRSGTTVTITSDANIAAGDRVVTVGSTNVTLRFTNAPAAEPEIPALDTTARDRGDAVAKGGSMRRGSTYAFRLNARQEFAISHDVDAACTAVTGTHPAGLTLSIARDGDVRYLVVQVANNASGPYYIDITGGCQRTDGVQVNSGL